ncbi:MAG: polysaccharide deacetylase family protein [Firmicutes bacterium]|nr:polysaccharide deacetylase family protein [Bacillota bacterium]
MQKVQALFLICVFIASAILFGFVTPRQVQSNVSCDEICLPILMYHNVLKTRKGKYVVSPNQLESDFIKLKELGYTTVFMSQVIDWVDGKGTLPEKPIVLTFDDGHYNNLHYALPLAKKHDIKFMLYPVTGFSKHTTDSGDHSNPNYSHLTWDQIKSAHESGHIEMGNHTHALHKFKPRFGIMKVGGEDMDSYIAKVKKDIITAQDLIEQSGVPRPTSFAYPFGKFSKEGRELLVDMGFRALLTCTSGVSTIKRGDAKSLHHLKRYNRDGHLTTNEVFNKLSD